MTRLRSQRMATSARELASPANRPRFRRATSARASGRAIAESSALVFNVATRETSLHPMILRDPVHGLISFEAAEFSIVPRLMQADEVQRLRRIRQLGLTSL